MTGPERLSLGARGSRLGVAIEAARRREPSADQLRALRANLLGVAAAPTGPTPRPHGGGWRIAVAKLATGLTLAAAGAGVTAVAWHRVAAPGTHAAPQPVAAAPLPVAVPTESPAAVAPPPAPSPPAPGRSAPHAHRAGGAKVAHRPSASAEPPPPVARPSAGADGELPLIEAAQRALPADPQLALTLLREHERRYPDGALQQEREVIAVTALVAVGQTDRARDRADSFARQHPDSTYLPRLRRILSGGEGAR